MLKIILWLLVSTLTISVSGCTTQPVQEPPSQEKQQTKENEANQQTGSIEQPNTDSEPTTLGIDTSVWNVYRNQEFGFELKHPQDWIAEQINGKIYFRYPGFRQNMPEGGSALTVGFDKASLKEFIDAYNRQDFSKIISQKRGKLDNIDSTELVGTTAIGINVNLLFVEKGVNNYIIEYTDFDETHKQIISTFRFLNNESRK